MTARKINKLSQALTLSLLLSASALGIPGGHGQGSIVMDDDHHEERTLGNDDESYERNSDHHHHQKHHAHSFQHFHGPVTGHHQEVSWKDEHGHHHHDYKAHPEYKFHYGVEDHHSKDFHGQKEHRDGKELSGEYHIHEPGGNVRTVKYHSDPHGGFFASVNNHGGNDHSGGTYGKH